MEVRELVYLPRQLFRQPGIADLGLGEPAARIDMVDMVPAGGRPGGIQKAQKGERLARAVGGVQEPVDFALGERKWLADLGHSRAELR